MKISQINEEKSFADTHELTQREVGLGYSEKEKKWYGYSHRAYCAFGIGDMIFDEDFGDDNTPYEKHGDKKIKNDADAKRSARNFAEYVS